MTSQLQTVTIAQARASTATGLLVADSLANIVAALPNPSLAARIASFTVTAGTSLSAAQKSLLFPIASKLHAPANSLALSGANTFTAAQLATYEALPGFTLSPSGSINLADTTAQVVSVLANHQAWFAQISSVTVHLDGTSIGAYPASQLNGLLVHGKTVVFVPSAGNTVLNIAAAAHDLATNMAALNALGTHQALSFTVTNDGTGVSAVDAVSLTALRGFSPSAHTLFVADTGANLGSHLAALIGQGFAQIQVVSGTLSATAAQLLGPSVHFLAGAHAQLASSVTLSAAAAASLAALPGLSDATGAVLTVADTAANLVAGGSAWQGAAGAVLLNTDATVSAGTAAALSQIASRFGANFSLSGHSVTVADTLPNLIALSAPVTSLATALLLSGNATATAAQFSAFQALPHLSFGGHTVALTDSATNLLSIAGADLSHVSSVSLTADAVVNVAQMLTLAAEPNFSAGGHTLIIADTAANLLTLPSNVLHLASVVELSADATLNAAASQALTSEAGYTADAHLLTVADSAAVLANLTGPVVAFAAAEQVNVSATISAATAAALASLPHLSEAAGVTLTIQDSMGSLAAASASALAVASAVRLIPGTTVVTDVSHAATLASIPGFSSAGSTIKVTDSLAHLEAAGTANWSSVASAYAVVDSVDAISAAAGSVLLTSATSVALTGPSVVTASAAATLAGMTNFTGAAQLSVADTTAALVSHSAALVSLRCPVTVTDSATIDTATAASLAQIAAASGAGFSFGHQALTIADTAVDLLSLTPAQSALAQAITLTADATLTAAQFTMLRSLPHVSLNGHILAVSDTAGNLTGLNGDLSMLSAATLSGDANVSVASLLQLTTLPNFSPAGHNITVIDTAANLLSAPALSLSQVVSAVLSTDATVNGQQAQLLTAEPGFTTGGHQLTIADTAENLLALPRSLLLSATSLALSSTQTVTANTLSQLATLGIKFTEANHTLTCVDTASNLATLSNTAVSLAHAEVLNGNSVVTAATAAALANLPAFSVPSGVSLTIQDSVTNLIALGHTVPTGTTVETLPAGSTTIINAQQAVALASIPHFTPVGAIVTVSDTVPGLAAAGNAVLQAVANTVVVTDTAANLAANAASPVVQTAALVSLSANAVVTAAMAAEIASIPHFAASNFQLEVVDTAANIAAHAAAVADVATETLVTDSGPISAAMADDLAAISATHILSFQGGNQLLLQDSYAALTDPTNSAGVALASRLGVLDTAGNLIVATQHNWGAINPSFTLSQGGIITANTAAALAALGSRFSTAGLQLAVADTAGAVVNAASAINALHLTASVTDTAANLSAQAAGLLGLGTAVTQVAVSDTGPVAASVASNLSSLASLLTGPALQVVGSAADVQASLPGLTALAGHVAIFVSDTAAGVAPYATLFAGLGSELTVSLTGPTTVTAALASALAPALAQLAPVQLVVSDTGAAVAAHAATLAEMGSVIGTINLSDGTTQTIANVSALAQLDSHLSTGVMLTATGTVADVVSNLNDLTTLRNDGRLAAISVSNSTVSDAEAHLATLNALSVSVSISDTASSVDADLSGLGQLNNLHTISLTDTGTPALSLTVESLALNTPTLAKITTPYDIAIVDTAAHIEADLASGVGSTIINHLSQIGQISTSDGQALLLDQNSILAAAVDSGPGSALALFTGSVQAVGVDVAHLSQVAALPRVPTSIAVTDTVLNVQQDLAQGGSSSILNNLGLLTSIATASDQAITLTSAQALDAGVDDSPHSAFGIMPDAILNVTAASVADLPQLMSLHTVPTAITVTDTAANLAADLGSTSSMIVANIARITAVSVTDGMPVSLSEQQLLAAGVDDSANSALAKASNVQLAVNHVNAADVSLVLGLSKAPVSISVADTASHVVSNLNSLLSNIGAIASIDVTSGTLTLSAAETLQSGTDDGSGSLVDRVVGHAFNVTGSTVSQLSALTALPYAPTAISVTDSSANIVADLVSGHSLLATAVNTLAGLTVTHGTLTMTDAQADVVFGNNSLNATLGFGPINRIPESAEA